MAINYKKHEWYDTSDTENRIPISADNLNEIEVGLQAAADKVDEMEPVYVKACDIKRILKTLAPDSGQTLSWTATEDCWISIYVSGNLSDDSYPTDVYLYVDGYCMFSAEMDSYSTVITNSFLLPPIFFVKQGSTISFTRAYNEAFCKIYGCLKTTK